MSDTISIEVEKQQVQKAIDNMVDLRRTLPLMQRIGGAMVTDSQMNFRRSSGPDGAPWAPLKHRVGKPLRDTGRLRNSITFDANNESVAIGTNLIYAPTHQFGAVIKPKKAGGLLKFSGKDKRFIYAKMVTIPARPFLGIKARQVKKINSIVDGWVSEIITK